MFRIAANVAYSINNPELITVAESDKILLTFREEMQNYLNVLNNAEIVKKEQKIMNNRFEKCVFLIKIKKNAESIYKTKKISYNV